MNSKRPERFAFRLFFNVVGKHLVVVTIAAVDFADGICDFVSYGRSASHDESY